ncbi:MAG TPA: DNA polymerase/3'-5' exonuclease PolX, partial [Calditrichia bacterium]|nr:DNA polymerase/3'-5' exonuclease PolX [Calditrichia bacterium]
KGANPFKIRAHENAARALDGLSENLATIAAAGKLTDIQGIGKGIAEKINLLLAGEKLAELEALREEIPAGLLDIARIPGVGPKKTRALWEEQGIDSVAALEAAARNNHLASMKGFGQKTQEKILHNIDLMRKFQDSHLLSQALEAGTALLAALRDLNGVIRCEIAGSLRRSKEVVKDIDIVVSAEEADRPAIMDFFTTLPEVASISGKGETKSSIVLESGINADLRIVSDTQFPYTLHHFTGSREHNVALRGRAQKMGMKVSEWGLFKGEELVSCADEADIYRALGLNFIPPELRENYGEIEAAEQGNLPELIRAEDIRGMIHTHSTWSDGANTLEEMVRGCRDLGYDYLVISDHSKAAAYANGLSVERIGRQHEEIERINAETEGFRVLKSIECDILSDGRLDYDDEVLATFDLVIISIHSKFNMTEAEATDRIIKAMENPFSTILGHMTGRLLLAREGYPVNQQAVIDAAADLGVCIEINANPRRLDLDWRFCKYARDKGVTIAINPDAHRISGFGDMQYGLGIARKGWLEKQHVLNCRSAEEVIAFAARRRT